MSDFSIDITAGRDRSAPQPVEDTPFRIGLIGDWSGRGSRGMVESAGKVAARRPHSVDRDDLEDAMEDLAVELSLTVEGNAQPLVLRFRSLDDFHPDQLYARLSLFEALRNLPT